MRAALRYLVSLASLVALAGLLLPFACATGPTSASPPSCEERRDAARRRIEDAFEANRQCSGDQECTAAPFATHCFDFCAHGVSVRGQRAVRDAIDHVNATLCASYEQDGCRLIHPPCIQPTSICKHGICNG